MPRRSTLAGSIRKHFSVSRTYKCIGAASRYSALRWTSGYAANLNGMTPFEKDINQLSHDYLEKLSVERASFVDSPRPQGTRRYPYQRNEVAQINFWKMTRINIRSTVLTYIAMDVAACTHTHTHTAVYLHIMIDWEVIVWE